MMMMYAGTSVPTGFLACDGSAVSRTTYAALFAVISTTWGIGDGSTTFNVPDMRDRVPIGSGTGTKVATFASRASNVITVTGLSNAAINEFLTGQAVLYSAPSGAMTGLTDNTTYYIVRTGNLTFSLATTLANAQNGTVISLSSDGTGTQTFTLTFTARTAGQTGGEENHAMSLTELLLHNHTTGLINTGGPESSAITFATDSGDVNQNQTGLMRSAGGNVAMNNMQPFGVVTYIIKT
jgi:microcystin-dependent protein